MEAQRISIEVDGGEHVTYDIFVDKETGLDIDTESGIMRTRAETEAMVRQVYSVGKEVLGPELDRYNKWINASSAKENEAPTRPAEVTSMRPPFESAKPRDTQITQTTNRVENISDVAESYKQEGNDHLQRGDIRRALQMYTKAITLDGDGNPVFYSNRAEAFIRLERYLSALEDLSVASNLIRSSPGSSSMAVEEKVDFRRVVCFVGLQRYADAKKACAEGLRRWAGKYPSSMPNPWQTRSDELSAVPSVVVASVSQRILAAYQQSDKVNSQQQAPYGNPRVALLANTPNLDAEEDGNSFKVGDFPAAMVFCSKLEGVHSAASSWLLPLLKSSQAEGGSRLDVPVDLYWRFECIPAAIGKILLQRILRLKNPKSTDGLFLDQISVQCLRGLDLQVDATETTNFSLLAAVWRVAAFVADPKNSKALMPNVQLQRCWCSELLEPLTNDQVSQGISAWCAEFSTEPGDLGTPKHTTIAESILSIILLTSKNLLACQIDVPSRLVSAISDSDSQLCASPGSPLMLHAFSPQCAMLVWCHPVIKRIAQKKSGNESHCHFLELDKDEAARVPLVLPVKPVLRDNKDPLSTAGVAMCFSVHLLHCSLDDASQQHSLPGTARPPSSAAFAVALNDDSLGFQALPAAPEPGPVGWYGETVC